jgi:acetylornithine deacetylase
MQDSYSSRELLAKLVAIDTTSSKTNLDLIDWVSRYLARHNVSAHITTNDAGTKANLFATLGPADEGGICLHGHTDVVPVEGQAWTSPAFELTEREGMLFGRGAADMKGFVACTLAAVPQFLARRLKTPVHIALSYDEEVGCFGTPRMIRTFGSQVAKPQIVIVGEPTLMVPVVAHKGVAAMETRFHGKAAHSSMPHLGANAMTAAAEMVAELGALCRELRTLRYPYPMNPSGPTFNVGTVHAGTARNIVAKEAVIEWEIRYRDTDSLADIQALIERRTGERIRRVLGTDAGGVDWETLEIVRVPSFCVRDAVVHPPSTRSGRARDAGGDASSGWERSRCSSTSAIRSATWWARTPRPAQRERSCAELGLDKPAPVQFARFVGHALDGRLRREPAPGPRGLGADRRAPARPRSSCRSSRR